MPTSRYLLSINHNFVYIALQRIDNQMLRKNSVILFDNTQKMYCSIEKMFIFVALILKFYSYGLKKLWNGK